MAIVFFCQSCGARFEVAEQSAGKKARCKKCGQEMRVPQAEQLASMVAMPVVAAAPAPAGAVVKTAAPPASSWIKNASSNVGLEPLSMNQIPIATKRGSAPSPLDDAEDSKPIELAGPAITDYHGRVSKPVSAVARVWRHETGLIQKIFRWLNEGAYLVSIPFIMIFLFGVVVKSRHIAIFGASFLVLLSIGRIVAGFANIAMVPLREGIHAGKKLKKPLHRVIEPVLTIAAVIVLFTFVPWLSSGYQGNIVERLESEAKELKDEIKGEVRNTVDGKNLKSLEEDAKQKLKNLGKPPADAPGKDSTPDESTPSPKSRIRGVIEGVGERARQTIDESQDNP